MLSYQLDYIVIVIQHSAPDKSCIRVKYVYIFADMDRKDFEPVWKTRRLFPVCDWFKNSLYTTSWPLCVEYII